MFSGHIIPVGTLLYSERFLYALGGIYIGPTTDEINVKEVYLSVLLNVVFIQAFYKDGKEYNPRMYLTTNEASALRNANDITKFVDIPSSMVSFINVLTLDGSMQPTPIITLNGKYIGFEMYSMLCM